MNDTNAKLTNMEAVEAHIEQFIEQIKSETMRQCGQEYADVTGRIYSKVFRAYQLALHEEIAINSKTENILCAIQSVMITILADVSRVVSPAERTSFAKKLTKDIGRSVVEVLSNKQRADVRYSPKMQ
jgi:hypothetical protein